jgi:hypothetical protein
VPTDCDACTAFALQICACMFWRASGDRFVDEFVGFQETLERDRLLFTLLRRSSTRRSLTKIFTSSSASPSMSEASSRGAARAMAAREKSHEGRL